MVHGQLQDRTATQDRFGQGKPHVAATNGRGKVEIKSGSETSTQSLSTNKIGYGATESTRRAQRRRTATAAAGAYQLSMKPSAAA